MENIIRSNAVKIESLGSSLGIASGKTSMVSSVIALAKATLQENKKNTDTAIARIAKVAMRQQLSALLLGRGVEGARIVIWAWTGKIAEVGHVQINNIKTLMAGMIFTMTTTAMAVVEAQASPFGLVKVGCLLKELQKLLRTIEVSVCGY